jgi:hypothetical protein
MYNMSSTFKALLPNPWGNAHHTQYLSLPLKPVQFGLHRPFVRHQVHPVGEQHAVQVVQLVLEYLRGLAQHADLSALSALTNFSCVKTTARTSIILWRSTRASMSGSEMHASRSLAVLGDLDTTVGLRKTMPDCMSSRPFLLRSRNRLLIPTYSKQMHDMTYLANEIIDDQTWQWHQYIPGEQLFQRRRFRTLDQTCVG